MSGYKPHQLDLDSVKLSENNPADDYQRLYFNQLHPLNIEQVNYKSNIVNTFNHPPWLDDIGSDTASSSRARGWNTLSCYEYQLPDVVSHSSSQNNNNSMDNTQFMLKGDIKMGKDTPLHDTVTNSNTAQRDKEKLVITNPSDKGNKSIYDLNTKTGRISLANNQDVESLSLQGNSTTQPHDNSTLTKNQQFKITKLNYNSNVNENLINPNNCILWDKNSGFVFLTGIWRLYQDIMNGLATMERTSLSSNSDSDTDTYTPLQQQCKVELDYILNYAFYEPISWDSKQTRRSRKSSITDLPTEQTHYVDLHWNNISKDLKHAILSDFQSTLKAEYPNHNFDHLDLSTHILQRIRGGYIKIQGTWLPWKVAKLICTRFCFPIRWLLVPLFGPSFPKDCEDYYFNVMLPNIKYIQQNSPANNNNIPTKKTSNKKRRRHTYSDISSTTSPKTVTNKRKRHSTTNISPPISPTNTYDLSPKSKNFNTKPPSPHNHNLNLNTNSMKQDHLPIPNITRGRSKSDFGIINHFNPLTNNASSKPSTLPPITSVFKQINPYDVPFLATTNDSAHPNNSIITSNSQQQPFTARPRLNSLPCPGVTTTSNNLHNENIPYPTVTTLSNLATFYNTRGHRYSYPKNFIQPTTLSSAGTTDNMKVSSSGPNSSSSNFTSFGFFNSQSSFTGNNMLNYQWSTGISDYQDSLPRSEESNYKENEPMKVESKTLKQSNIRKTIGH